MRRTSFPSGVEPAAKVRAAARFCGLLFSPSLGSKHRRRVGRGQRHGDGIVMHVQPDTQRRTGGSRGGRRRRRSFGGAHRAGFCGSTGFSVRSMYGFMVFAFRFLVVWGASPTTGGSAPLTRRTPRLPRRADITLAPSKSHTD